MDKNEIRARIYAARRARYDSPTAEADRSATAAALAVAGLTLACELAAPSSRIVTFVSMRREPPMNALNSALVTTGFDVIAPVTLPDLDLDWARLGDDVTAAVTSTELTQAEGHSELLGADAVTTASLLFVPGVAVDATGTRLGRGGGSYDRALGRRHPDSRIIVVLHDDEVVDYELPREAHDEVVDGVLTPSGYQAFGVAT
ncbi:MAG: 5-formyltetrahydrofolate cyclo-ligase [Dermatophilus congolensis]|nr:5-formyltetrahydrofolate cyclo-ligase [Dermatophilus congolensis]